MSTASRSGVTFVRRCTNAWKPATRCWRSSVRRGSTRRIDAGKRRLDDPGDYLRQEIAVALVRNIPVTPVLVQGAAMPAPERLPDDLKELAFRNGFELSHTRWHSDVREMAHRLGLDDAHAVRGANRSQRERPRAAQSGARLAPAPPRG